MLNEGKDEDCLKVFEIFENEKYDLKCLALRFDGRIKKIDLTFISLIKLSPKSKEYISNILNKLPEENLAEKVRIEADF